MSDAKLASLETKGIVVQSHFDDTIFVVDKEGKGMWILVDGKEIPVAAENVEAFAKEILEVWKLHGRSR